MSAQGSRLAAVTKDLWVNWQQTRESWSDAKAMEFEQKYLRELMNSVDKTVGAIEQLDKLIAKIKKDCE
jgi:thymidylate synthase